MSEDNNRTLLGYLVETQKDQTRTLGLLSTMVARVEEKVGSWYDRDREQDERTSEIDRRVTVLEHEQTRSKTTLRIMWAALCVAGSAVSWLLSR